MILYYAEANNFGVIGSCLNLIILNASDEEPRG
jgi:hypothetical protein